MAPQRWYKLDQFLTKKSNILEWSVVTKARANVYETAHGLGYAAAWKYRIQKCIAWSGSSSASCLG